MAHEFRHTLVGFTADELLLSVGVTRRSVPDYLAWKTQMESIIVSQVMNASRRLNTMLKNAYRKDMLDIVEYYNFPRYIEVMMSALSKPGHTGIWWDEFRLPQAKFVDLDSLGDLSDLLDIARQVHPAGTLANWVILYNNWFMGRHTKPYEDTVNARLDIMSSRGMAPFWELIENGNPGGYPSFPRMQTLLKFDPVYQSEMRNAYNRCRIGAQAIAAQALLQQVIAVGQTVVFGGRAFIGEVWKSKSGKWMFTEFNTKSIDASGKLTAKGFFLDTDGQTPIRPWSGWLPD